MENGNKIIDKSVNVDKLIKDIKTFRKDNKGKFVSTTHYLSRSEWNMCAFAFPSHFSEFSVMDISRKRYPKHRYVGKIEITIRK